MMKKADSLLPEVSRKKSAESGSVSRGTEKSREIQRDHVDVINQLFAELELAYHNQYHKAYAQEGSVNVAKKYWLECLCVFPPEIMLKAVRNVVKTREYLPTVAAMVEACEEVLGEQGLPTAHDAYVEACCAPHPKAEQHWSHPAVYLAGKETGWFELANQIESRVFPQFEKHYRKMVRRVLAGEDLVIDIPKALPEKGSRKLSAEENKERMAALRKQL